MLRVKEDYFRAGDSFLKSPELPELLDDMDAQRRRAGDPASPGSVHRRPRPTVREPSARSLRARRRRFEPAAAHEGAAGLESFVKDHPVAYASVGPELLGRRHVPAERRRLLPALRQVLRARPPALREHGHPRPAAPRRGPEPDPPRPRVHPVPGAEALHDPRGRPVVGRRHPADAQVPQPAAHDLGVVAEAPARVAAPLHAHARQGPDPLRFRLPGAVDGAHASARPRRSTSPDESATVAATRTPKPSSSTGCDSKRY